jgi:class 3 adenylate cyclase
MPSALLTADWGAIGPLQVRMALHTTAAEPRDGDYLAPGLNRLARLLAAGHGGQVLVSLATQELARDALPAGASLRDLGGHPLRDLYRPERVFQLHHARLPARSRRCGPWPPARTTCRCNPHPFSGERIRSPASPISCAPMRSGS